MGKSMPVLRERGQSFPRLAAAYINNILSGGQIQSK
jgi:hypothetical protein